MSNRGVARYSNRDTNDQSNNNNSNRGRGRGGVMIGRGGRNNNNYHNESDDDEDDEDDSEDEDSEGEEHSDDDDDDEHDDCSSCGEEEEEDVVEDIEQSVLDTHVTVLKSFESNPSSVNIDVLKATLTFLISKVRAATCTTYFTSDEGSRVLFSLIKELSADAPRMEFNEDLANQILKVFVEFSISRKSVDPFNDLKVLPQLLTIAKKFNSNAEVVNSVLETVDYVIQHSNTRRATANQYAGMLNDKDGNSIDVAGLLGADPRIDLVQAGFMEFVLSKFGSLDNDSLNLSLNIFYELVDDSNGKENYHPKEKYYFYLFNIIN